MPPNPARPAALSSTLAMPSSARSLAKANTDVSMVRMLAAPDVPNARRLVRINFDPDDGGWRSKGLPAPAGQVGAHRRGHAKRLRPRRRSAGGARRAGDDRGTPGVARLVPGSGTAGGVHPVHRRPVANLDVEMVARNRTSCVLLLAGLHARLRRHRRGARLRGCYR